MFLAGIVVSNIQFPRMHGYQSKLNNKAKYLAIGQVYELSYSTFRSFVKPYFDFFLAKERVSSHSVVKRAPGSLDDPFET